MTGEFYTPEKEGFKPAERQTIMKPNDNLRMEGEFTKSQKQIYQSAEKVEQTRHSDNLKLTGSMSISEKNGYQPGERMPMRKPQDNLRVEGEFVKREQETYQRSERVTQKKPQDNLTIEKGKMLVPAKQGYSPGAAYPQKRPKDNLQLVGKIDFSANERQARLSHTVVANKRENVTWDISKETNESSVPVKASEVKTQTILAQVNGNKGKHGQTITEECKTLKSTAKTMVVKETHRKGAQNKFETTSEIISAVESEPVITRSVTYKAGPVVSETVLQTLQSKIQSGEIKTSGVTEIIEQKSSQESSSTSKSEQKVSSSSNSSSTRVIQDGGAHNSSSTRVIHGSGVINSSSSQTIQSGGVHHSSSSTRIIQEGGSVNSSSTRTVQGGSTVNGSTVNGSTTHSQNLQSSQTQVDSRVNHSRANSSSSMSQIFEASSSDQKSSAASLRKRSDTYTKYGSQNSLVGEGATTNTTNGRRGSRQQNSSSINFSEYPIAENAATTNRSRMTSSSINQSEQVSSSSSTKKESLMTSADVQNSILHRKSNTTHNEPMPNLNTTATIQRKSLSNLHESHISSSAMSSERQSISRQHRLGKQSTIKDQLFMIGENTQVKKQRDIQVIQTTECKLHPVSVTRKNNFSSITFSDFGTVATSAGSRNSVVRKTKN